MSETAQHHVPPTFGAIERSLRDHILKGRWSPGQQLPTHDELLKEFRTSRATIQRALDRLIADGFVEAHRGRGRFVSDRPPHLTDYALIFPSSPDSPTSWGGHWRGLSWAAREFERSGERRFPEFHDISGHPDSEDYQNLIRSLRSQRLAGLIFASNPFYLVSDPILEQPGIPRVAFMTPRPDMPIHAVGMDYVAFCDRTVDYLATRGRKRVAALFFAGLDDNSVPEERFVLALQKRGLAYKPHWFQYVNVFHPTAVCRAVQMLFHSDQTLRPDALVVTDDTMLDAAMNGLFASGVNVPRDVEVVAHANFPVKPTAVPVKHLGYDSRKVLQTCVRLIDQQRRGEPSAPLTELSPQFADEIEETVVP